MVITQLKSSDSVSVRTSRRTQVSSVSSRVAPWLMSLLYPLARYVVVPNYFGSFEVVGRENLPAEGPFILAPIHRSRWDAIVVPFVAGRYGTGRDLHFMVMAIEMKGIQGWFIRRSGGFPVNLKRPGIASLRHGIELLQQGEAVVIFPEGGIFRDRTLHPLKQGLARLALQAELMHPGLGIQVIPMDIDYGQALPSWGCNVQVRIGSPLNVVDYRADSTKQGARNLTTDLTAALKRLMNP